MVPLLSVRVTNNTEKTFSMFSKDPSRSFTLSQHWIRHAQWATNMSMWACFPPPFSIHWYAAFSAMGKLAWAFVSNVRTVCLISTKQAFYSLKPPGKSYVPQVGVRLVRMAYFRFSQMLNERGYERQTNCSGMHRTSSRLLRSQRVHQACRICVHANELAAAWPDQPTLI